MPLTRRNASHPYERHSTTPFTPTTAPGADVELTDSTNAPHQPEIISPWLHDPHRDYSRTLPHPPAYRTSLPVSDGTIIPAVLFGASVGNLATRPVLIVSVWFGYALYAFYGDLCETLDRRRERMVSQVGAFAANIIVGGFRAFMVILSIMLLIGFVKVMRMFW